MSLNNVKFKNFTLISKNTDHISKAKAYIFLHTSEKYTCCQDKTWRKQLNGQQVNHEQHVVDSYTNFRVRALIPLKMVIIRTYLSPILI